jgi:bacteriocin biosynthesis cyclodehydratase domain-containing protein
MNQRILAEGLTALLVMVAGWSVSVGPVVAPAGGGPCLVCLQERYRATVQAAIDWSGRQPVRVLTVGASLPEQDAVRFALRLARRVVRTAQKPTAGLSGPLTTMRKVALDTCEVQRLSCHPVPWCPACAQTTEHRLIMVDR